MTALRRRMLEDMEVRNLSAGTQQVYLQHISRFAHYCGRSPAELGPEEIRAYQLYLTNEKQLAPATLVIVVAALRFLYRVTLQKTWAIETVIPAPKKPQTLPVVLSPAEMGQFLDSVQHPKHRTILTTCYAAGLRISEAVRLTVPAIDSQRMVLRIVQGERAAGPLCDALPEAVGDAARLVASQPASALALSRSSPRAPDDEPGRRPRLPPGPSSQRSL